MKLEFFRQIFEKHLGIKFYKKNRPVGAEFYTVGRTDEQTDVMKLIVAAPTIVHLAVSVFMCFILVS